jgi:hypothetical protein
LHTEDLHEWNALGKPVAPALTLPSTALFSIQSWLWEKFYQK